MIDETKQQAGWKQKIIHELNEYWVNFVYLAFFFVVFTTYRRLILEEYRIGYFNYGIGVIEAAVLAKVILLGDAVHLGRKYEDRPLIVPTLYKTFIFIIWVLAFKVFEHVIGGLLHGKGLAGGLHELISKDWHEMLANALVTFSAFVPFFALKELGRVMGEGKILASFFRRKGTAGSGRPSDSGRERLG